MKEESELKKDNTQTHTCCPKCGCVHVGDCKFQLKENEWLPINQKQLPSDRLICEWKHPEYGVITGSLIWDGGKLESEKSWWVFPVGGAEADISLDEFTHYRKIYKPVPDRPTPVVQAKTAEELVKKSFTPNYIERMWTLNDTVKCMEAYHAQFAPSAKSVEVEEEKSENLPEYKFRKFKITGLTPDAYVELNNKEIKNINGMIPCLASRLVDYPYMFVMPDGKSCHSDWLLFETFESEQEQKQADAISRMQARIDELGLALSKTLTELQKNNNAEWVVNSILVAKEALSPTNKDTQNS